MATAVAMEDMEALGDMAMEDMDTMERGLLRLILAMAMVMSAMVDMAKEDMGAIAMVDMEAMDTMVNARLIPAMAMVM